MDTNEHQFTAETQRRGGQIALIPLQRNEPRQAVFVFDVLVCITQVALFHGASDDRTFAHVSILRLAAAHHKQRKMTTRVQVLHFGKFLAPFSLACRISNPNLRRRTLNQRIEILPNAKSDNFCAIDQDEMNACRARSIKGRDGMITILLTNFWSFIRHVSSMVVSSESSTRKTITFS